MRKKLKEIAEEHGDVAMLNYQSAMVGLMCLRDYEYWNEINEPCPCPECKGRAAS